MNLEYKLQRTVKNKDGTCGVWISAAGIALCSTLERPDNGDKPDNPKTKENDSGCIPAGSYDVRWTFSNKFNRFTFEILGVQNRAGIRIHSANNIGQLLGCIAVGTEIDFDHPDIHKPYKYWLMNSKEALKKIEGLLPKEFTLTIIDPA